MTTARTQSEGRPVSASLAARPPGRTSSRPPVPTKTKSQSPGVSFATATSSAAAVVSIRPSRTPVDAQKPPACSAARMACGFRAARTMTQPRSPSEAVSPRLRTASAS